MRVAVITAVLVAALAAVPAGAQQKGGKKIQCWTDKNGARMCGDQVPPEYAGEKREVMKGGRVVDTIDASKSADEREAEKRKKDAELAKQKQAEYDRALLEMYRGQSDITAMRDERISLIDMRMQAAEKNASDTDKSLAGLRARAEAAEKKGEPVDDKLAKQIKQFEKSQQENTAALDRYRKEREALQAKFDRDYMRYAELRGLPVTAPPPPKAHATAATPAKPADPKAGQAATPAKPAEPAKPQPKAGG
jgi:DNA repair exonuclease SbcCD ATPase subunit